MTGGHLIRPFTSPARGVAVVPGSKSHTNRALVCAALATGTSELSGVLFADDTRAMLGCLAALGVDVVADETAERVTVTGLGGAPASEAVTIDARLSGTTSRFLLPVLAAGTGRVTLDGGAPLRERPFDDQLVALRELGAAVEENGRPGRLPLTVAGSEMSGGQVRVPADVSSQFTSGLLLAAPVFSGPLGVVLEGDVVSRPYLDLTVDVMTTFGADVQRPDDRTFRVAPTGYTATSEQLEPDASAASYFLAAAAISTM